MKKFVSKHKQLIIIIVIVLVIGGIALGNKIYKNFYLTSEVYRTCNDDGLTTLSCKYYMFQKSGKVYSITQNISYKKDFDERENIEKLLLKNGIDNVIKKCSGYGYCKDVLEVSDTMTGVYTINSGRITIDWDSEYDTRSYFKIKDGAIWALDSDMQITNTSYYPAGKDKEWEKCRKNNNCDEVFSIDDPLNDFDYSTLHLGYENMLDFENYKYNCNYVFQYAYKDITGDGIDEMLVRSSYNGNDWNLVQIYYGNTWIEKILPLGDDELPYDSTTISEVYEGGYIYIYGKHLSGGYYKVSEDGFLLDYVGDSEYDLPNQKSLYDTITNWQTINQDKEYCKRYE